MKQVVSRRSFMTSTVIGGVSAYAFARPAWAAPLGANDAVRVAVVGVGSREVSVAGKGRHHIAMLKAIPGVRIVALCDVDEELLDEAAQALAVQNIRVEKYVDIRKLLESKDLDAISIATPNHWHSLMAIWACQAGKDVYVEKPISHNVWEGRKVVEAAARYGRIVQAGTQSRSDEALLELEGYLRSGQLGTDPPGPRILLQAPGEHRQGRRPSADSVQRPLRSVVRASAARPALPQAAALRLALGLGHRQRRHREPGHPRDGHVPVDAGRGEAPAPGVQHRRALRLRRRRRDTQHADLRARLPEGSDPLRGTRASPRRPASTTWTTTAACGSAIVIECENGYFAGGAGGGWVV